MTTSIPQPPGIPLLGNVTLIEKDVPLRSLMLLASTYGEIYQLNMLGNVVVFCSSYDLVNELSDEKRFKKQINASLNEVRSLVGDGLFTAHNEEENWGIAHRLLMPAFGPVAIRTMMPGMNDIAAQLLLKWERFGPEHIIDPADDFTRLALDTIALCSMSYRLNSFYSKEQPKFSTAMIDWLKESGARANRPTIVQAMMTGTNRKYHDDIEFMRNIANKIVAERKTHPSDDNDLLNKMLSGKDPKTGQGMSDESIERNLLTFLVAGHETTAGTLSFIFYHILKNAEPMRRLREEVDSVIGNREPEAEDFSKMPYLQAVMREAMRLQPTAPGRAVTPLEDTTIGHGKYAVKKGQVVVILTPVFQTDPKIWGDDAHEYKPERLMDGKWESLPPNAWQPFGFGTRGCIGRAFAWQEMQLIVSSVIQRFDLSMVDPSYTLELKQALTIKPRDFFMHAKLRQDREIPPLSASQVASSSRVASSAAKASTGKQPLYVLYGGNSGTCESFAQRIASTAPTNGFIPKLATLDSVANRIPSNGPIVVITASYEGEPADNAAQFVDNLMHLPTDGSLSNVRYTIFGCGNHDWVQTFHRVPKLIDSSLEKRGAKKLYTTGLGDAGVASFFQEFDDWESGLWSALTKEYNTTRAIAAKSSGVAVKILAGDGRAKALRQPDAALGRVIQNKTITRPGAPEKRHIEFQLPKGMSAQAGDYLAIIPHNPVRDVHRILSHFEVAADAEVELTSIGPTSLPTDAPISVASVLGGYVEISQPATTRDLRILLDAVDDQATRNAVEGLVDSYAEEVFAKRLSVLDILEKYPAIKITLGDFLALLPAMRVRQYSISSSPLWNPEHVTLTIGVVEAPAISGKEEPFLGVASTFLAQLRPGDRVQMVVRPSNSAFHLPADLATEVVMFCAGSGIAPMRGFIQERAIQKATGREVGKMVLFFGCRDPEQDYLYSDTDLKDWVELGVVDIKPAFSRKSEASEGCKHVQDRIWYDRKLVQEAYNQGAKFYTCGAGKVAIGIKAKLHEIVKANGNSDDATTAAKLERILKDRYAADIFD